MQGDRRRLDVLGEVVQRPDPDDLAVAEEAPGPGDLGVEQLGAHGVALAAAAEGPANASEQYSGHVLHYLSWRAFFGKPWHETTRSFDVVLEVRSGIENGFLQKSDTTDLQEEERHY